MNIILLENVEKLGFKNEIVKVKPGYGRNFLIPSGKAKLATESAVKVLQENLRQQEQKDSKIIAEFNKTAEALPKLEINIIFSRGRRPPVTSFNTSIWRQANIGVGLVGCLSSGRLSQSSYSPFRQFHTGPLQ